MNISQDLKNKTFDMQFTGEQLLLIREACRNLGIEVNRQLQDDLQKVTHTTKIAQNLNPDINSLSDEEKQKRLPKDEAVVKEYLQKESNAKASALGSVIRTINVLMKE